MLQRTISAFARASGPSRFLVLAGALFAASSMGCAAVASGEQEADAKFLVAPKSDTSFFGWSEITIDQEATSVDKATLRAVTLEVLEPASITDLRFIENITGEAVTSKERTKAVEKKAMPPEERVVPLDITYDGDLRGFFEDKHTIRIEWNGKTSSTFTAWPAEGIWIRAHIIVLIE